MAARKQKNVPSVKQVKLKLVHISFWSAVKTGFLITTAAGIATIVGFFLIWLIISQTGLFGSLSNLLASVVGGDGADLAQTLSLPRVMAFALVLSLFNMIVGTALAGISAIVFNVIGRLTGGIAVGFTNN